MRTIEQEQTAMRSEARSGDVIRGPAERITDVGQQTSAPVPGSARLAQAMGFLVFLFGIGIIVFVLIQAFHLYQNPTLAVSGGNVVNPSAVQTGVDLIGLIVRIALLFLGSISGSLIANKGINLYFTALRRE